MILGQSEVRSIHNQKQFKEQAALLYTEEPENNIIYDIVDGLRVKWALETNKYCAWYQKNKVKPARAKIRKSN